MRILLVVCVFVFCGGAVAGVPPVPSPEQQSVLDRVSSVFAERPVSAGCVSRAEWNRDPLAVGAWGYVLFDWFGAGDQSYLAPLVCFGAANVADPSVSPWLRALGALVLTHESYHMRHWAWARDEGRVECQAVRHFTVAVQLLGGSREDARVLLPYALELHWKLAALFPAYLYRHCGVPHWYHGGYS